MKKFMLLSMILVLGIMSFVMTACGKPKEVSFTYVNEVATFIFDSENYVVGDTATFTVDIDNMYSQSNYTVYANDELLSKSSDGKYQYTLNSETVSFEIKDYEINTYSYVFENVGFELSTLHVGNITHGESFSFFVTTNMYQDDYVVKVNNTQVAATTGGEYIVTNVTSNLNIVVENAILNTYNLTFDIANGINIVDYDFTDTVVNYGESITFDVILVDGYEKNNFEVKANNVTVPYDNGYTVSNITANTTITISGVRIKRYSITYVSTPGIINVTDTTVSHGSLYTISYTIADNYHMTENFKVFVNGEVVYSYNGTSQTSFWVRENMVITFTGLELDSYTVLYNGITGINITGEESVTHGEDYTFTYSLIEGYEVTGNFDIKVNNVSVYQNDVFTYTIEDVHDNILIEFIGVQRITYNVVFENTFGLLVIGNSGLYITDNETVEYGENYSFSFTAAVVSGYTYLPNFDVLCNGESIFDGTYQYTISNIKENITISFIGVGLVKHNISYTLNIPNSCDVVLSSTEVEHGDSYTVTITAKEGYDISKLVCRIISIDSPSITIEKNGNQAIITVSHVYNIQEVLITGVEEIPVQISFHITSLPVGIEYVLLINDVPYENGVGSDAVELTEESIILLEIMYELSGYTINYDMFDVLVVGGIITCEDEYYVYSIANITADISIVLQGVYKDDEYILIYENSIDYNIILKDKKVVYSVEDYVNFDVEVIGDYINIEVLVNDTPLVYVTGTGYSFQIKDDMAQEINISVIITR